MVCYVIHNSYVYFQGYDMKVDVIGRGSEIIVGRISDDLVVKLIAFSEELDLTNFENIAGDWLNFDDIAHVCSPYIDSCKLMVGDNAVDFIIDSEGDYDLPKHNDDSAIHALPAMESEARAGSPR
jgi:hypothetical protein